ncbi:4'-phosphopantetheinyl transferase superfamily protein [Streptomyces sioyaensis]|uniref:4'-phosphopantetheinyl transferase family protein n=1 Tax=Streptomyces sioyaensis TaxID=67364 RepID=UPI0033D6732D
MTCGPPAPPLFGRHTPAQCHLPSHTVELWAVEVGDCDPAALRYAAGELLSSSERSRAEGFRSEAARREFLLGRVLLRSCLSHYLGGAPAAWRLRAGAEGKPELAEGSGGGGRTVAFNLSHSEGLCLLGFTGGPTLGVDIEKLRPLDDLESLSAVLLTRAERRSLSRHPPDLRTRQFFERWVLKEAYAKARGSGMSPQFGAAGFTVGPGAPPRPEAGPTAPRNAESWQFRLLDLYPGFAGALAVSWPGGRPARSFSLRRVTPFHAVHQVLLTDRGGDGRLRAAPYPAHPPLARRGPL